jgi:putative ABC transport system permease protein
MLQEIRVTLRLYARKPVFTAGVVGVLALGIGANVSVFQLAWNLLYRPLPYGDPGSLVRVWSVSADGRSARLGFSVPRFEHFREGQRSFAGVAGDVAVSLTLTDHGGPIPVSGLRVTANYFDVLGIKPVVGRGFRREEQETGGVAMITHRFWRDRLGGAADVLGRSLTLDGAPHSIIGVVPALPAADVADADVFITRPYDIGLAPAVLQRGVSFLRFSGRLHPTTALDEATAEMSVLAESYKRERPENADAAWLPRIVPIREDLSGRFRPAVSTLFGAVSLVLLLACSNVANLLTSHFLARTRELALRAALGAGSWRTLRGCLIESTVVSTAGATVGLIAAVALPQLLSQIGANLPLDPDEGPPWALLGYATMLALISGTAIGVYPGLQSTRLPAFDALRAGRGAIGGRHRLQEVLVGVQVAVSVILLFSAGLLIQSFRQVTTQDPGFELTNVLSSTINLPPRSYPTGTSQNTFYEALRERLNNQPGIQSAALIAGFPLSGALSRAPFARADRAVPPNERPLAPTRSVTPGYFATMGISILAGRDFTHTDDEEAPMVVILSQSTARRLFPGEDALGRTILAGSSGGGIEAEVIGVVGDVRSLTLTETSEVEIYRPFAQRPVPVAHIAVKARGSPMSAVGVLREVVRSLDPELPLTQVSTADDILANSLSERRMLMTLLGAFAVLAFLLSAVGIHAVLAFTVGRRTAEIGVRMALGARRDHVVRLVVGHGVRPVLLGAFLGLCALPLVSRRISEQLFQVSPLEPRIIAIAVALILVIATFASLTPARRAANIDPIATLKAE